MGASSTTPQGQNPKINYQDIQDVNVRKNFQNIADYFKEQNQFLNFQFQELVFTGAVTAQAIAHTLGVIPQDIIVTKITGAGTATFLHGQFTSSNMYITTSGACRIRFFYGTYFNFQSTTQNQSSDVTAYSAGPSATSKNLLSLVSAPLTSTQLASAAFGSSNGSQYQMQLLDDIVEVNLTSTSAYSVLLQPVANMAGRVVRIVKIGTDTKTLIVKTNTSTELFTDGSTSISFSNAGEYCELYCDGVAWRVLVFKKAFTIQIFLTGSGTYVRPGGCKQIEFYLVGAGGGGGGGGVGGGGGTGTNSTFGGSTAGGGSGGGSNAGSQGGGGTATLAAGLAGLALTGSNGNVGSQEAFSSSANQGGAGGNAPFFAGAAGYTFGNDIGVANSGGGGGGGGGSTARGGSGGGSGAVVWGFAPAAFAKTYAYSIGGGGGSGSAGAAGSAGGKGSDGRLVVIEHY